MNIIHRKTLGRILAALMILLLSAGCSGLSLKNKEEMSAEELARIGLAQYDRGKYFLAVETFDIIKERFPFSKFSLLAELKSADSNFHMGKYLEARELYKEFEKNHPTNEAIPYVIFQIGRCHYRTIDTVDRDPSGAHEAIRTFSRLLRSYPTSPYTAEAKALISKANNFLADHELYVATFYMRTKEYDQARGRLEYLLTAYPDTPTAAKAAEMLKKLDDPGNLDSE